MFEGFRIRTLRRHARAIFDAAVGAVDPAIFLARHLPAPPESGRLVIFALGKAAGSMARAAEMHYLHTLKFPPARLSGIALTRYGYARHTERVKMMQSGHPLPDAAGLAATQTMLELADRCGPDDLALVLISGGASANLVAPAPGVSFEDKLSLNIQLLCKGIAIDNINIVRKHISQVKGGRLAQRLAPARIVTIALSDVPGDDPSLIGSGPSVPDLSTLEQSRAILARHDLNVPQSIWDALNDPANESLKPDHPAFERASCVVAARPLDGVAAACRKAEQLGYHVIDLGGELEGEARVVAAQHAGIARGFIRSSSKLALISGGELTVTVKGRGRGGPNQEYALALAIALEGARNIAGLAGDTDGTDGGSGDMTDPAGGYFDPTTLSRAAKLGLDPVSFLENNDSGRFFGALHDRLLTGPTLTNANDIRVILIND